MASRAPGALALLHRGDDIAHIAGSRKDYLPSLQPVLASHAESVCAYVGRADVHGIALENKAAVGTRIAQVKLCRQ